MLLQSERRDEGHEDCIGGLLLRIVESRIQPNKSCAGGFYGLETLRQMMFVTLKSLGRWRFVVENSKFARFQEMLTAGAKGLSQHVPCPPFGYL